MKHLLKYVVVALGLFTFVACGEKKDDTTQQDVTYSYNHDNSSMEWVAFKFVRKAPVKGTFTKMDITCISEATDIETIAKSFGFTIPVNSIETQDDSRNAKIIEFFFGTLSTETLTGRIVDLNNGKATLEVTMNGVTDKVNGTYEIIDNNFSFHATMDIAKWNANKAIDALNAVCKENHTEDGVTKVWSEVDLSFTTKFDKK